MSEIANNKPLVQAASLSLPALAEQCDEIDQFVAQCDELSADLSGVWKHLDFQRNGKPWTPAEREEAKQLVAKQLELAKQLVAKRSARQQLWSVLSQPANDDQLINWTAAAVASFPNLSKIESTYFAQAIADEIASEAPTLYMLRQALSAVRRKHEFLSIKVVVDEIERARLKAEKREYRLHGNELGRTILSVEEEAEKALPIQPRWQPRQLPDLPPGWRFDHGCFVEDES